MKTPSVLLTLLVGLTASAAVTACGSASTAAPEPATAASAATSTPAAPQARRSHCPMPVPDTSVSERDIEGGAALVFTTGSDELDQLRENARNIADVYNHRDQGEPLDEPTQAQVAPTDDYMAMPQVDVAVTEIDRGAQLELHPKDPATLASVRARANIDASRIASGQCIVL